MKKYEIGLIGLSVMGQNLALNIARNHSIAVYNRTESKTRAFMKDKVKNQDLKAAYELEDFVASLEKPRKIMLMIKAGKPVDLVIDSLLPYLEAGDIIIDGGNSHFDDTNRRLNNLKEKDIRYLGVGISGGEYGALHGPSIMPGGNEKAYAEVSEIMEDAAAQTEKGACVSYLGPNSAGHYVKMVHNGIEYGIMEVLAEIYDYMRKVLQLKPEEMGDIFAEWNQEFDSYLVEITAKIMKKDDPKTGRKLIDLILDKAKHKGTGKWSVQSALDLGTAVPTINAGVNARLMSAIKSERVENAAQFADDTRAVVSKDEMLPALKSALYFASVIAYAEGFKLLKTASEEYNYQLNYKEIARIWEDGCIIRSGLLEPIQAAFADDMQLKTLITAHQFKTQLNAAAEEIEKLITTAAQSGLPLTAVHSALDYFNSLKSEELPANLIQAQRDFFGAHTYQRRDEEGIFHTEWE
ncbi:MAG: 6-phosphogluconate dehydrogenase [Halanaerobium sp.]|jgi:6-phosphogluconate dehydrogenase|uniref:6-phosphogluconate dehydrogenase, decarboxylating n=1 Tax=Halanaerobium saccharolyticum TaxID=43595 RepID=A0A4R6SED0_9FIRM|nr:NADP-dependent phosphogluconate dehydrogenase [Halanaerobium saccharolyticum]PUU94550.1 MAG: 6-phosphogluconate dehydrogenase [Halanaerobium sp.]TDP98301.1 6-phosphogluconate dehydrogenase [Halanaerobium saccharolyticum]